MQPGVRQPGPFLDVIVLETKGKSPSERTHSHVQSHEITLADQDDLPVGVLMKDAWWDLSWEPVLQK